MDKETCADACAEFQTATLESTSEENVTVVINPKFKQNQGPYPKCSCQKRKLEMAQEEATSKEKKSQNHESECDSEEENEAKLEAYLVAESRQWMKDKFNQEMEVERNKAIAQGINPNDKGMQTEDIFASLLYLHITNSMEQHARAIK